MLQAEREISKLQMENERLTNSLTEENDVNMKNRHELQEQVINSAEFLILVNYFFLPCMQMTSLKVLEHQVDQYQTSADIERNAKVPFVLFGDCDFIFALTVIFSWSSSRIWLMNVQRGRTMS